MSLNGLRLLNTRPANRAAPLTQALRQAGAEVDELPLLVNEPIEPGPSQRGLLMDLDRYRAVFVVSPTAAALGLECLRDVWPQWPVGVAWIAVGEATARVLEQAGLAPWVPAVETSEGVLALPPLAALGAGDRVLVLRGEGGRNLVRDWLQSRAVRVDYLDLYRRRLPEAAAVQWRALSADRAPHAVILTSGESLRNWLAVAGARAGRIPAVVVSARLAAQTREAGVHTVIDAGGVSPGAIIAALATWRRCGGHGIE
jgi:uroporphyrinogen-III synthase